MVEHETVACRPRRRATVRHRISNHDADARTADCSECGPVNVYYTRDRHDNQKRRPYCAKAQQGRTKAYKRDRIDDHMYYKYGMRRSDYAVLSKRQNHVCAICSEKQFDGRDLYIDHCHVDNEVRGLLCSKCNWALGLLQDSPDLMRRAANYVEDKTARPGFAPHFKNANQ